MTVIEMIARNARMYPNDIALIELRPSQKLRKQITWNNFDDRISRVANALIELITEPYSRDSQLDCRRVQK